VQTEPILAWLVAFVFTQLIEVPLYRRLLDCSLLRAFGASAITHPIVWFAIMPLLPLGYWQNVVVAELFAWGVEALWFGFGYGVRRAVWSALVANAISLGLGLLSRAVLGAP
jgi:hypothetical protein